jgi:uncharacterized protein (DUF169 family)
MTSYAPLADRLESALGLAEAVGIVITGGDAEPSPSDNVEASCVHWSSVLTSGRVRRTAPADHAGCSVGSYVHGMSTLEQAAAAEDTATLVAAGWVEPATLGRLPTLPPGAARIDYVPLRELDREPQVVLLALTPEQLMAVRAAIPSLRLTGKPQCQIIPLAAAGVPCASLGCAVSRARTAADPGQMTCALPAQVLARAIGALEVAAAADQAAASAVRLASREPRPDERD